MSLTPGAAQIKHLVVQLREQWGGTSESDCVKRMSRMAIMVSGGIEMA